MIVDEKEVRIPARVAKYPMPEVPRRKSKVWVSLQCSQCGKRCIAPRGDTEPICAKCDRVEGGNEIVISGGYRCVYLPGLKREMQRNGLNGARLMELMDRSTSTHVYKWVRLQSRAKLETAEEIAGILGCTVEDLRRA